MNNWSFTGNLGQDCRKNEAGGTAVVNFSVAVKSGYGDKAQTVWVDCSLWGKPAEGALPQYLVKGQAVGVTGELSTQEKDGKTYLKVRCNSVDLLGSKSDTVTPAPTHSGPPQASAEPKAADPADVFDDDIPF